MQTSVLHVDPGKILERTGCEHLKKKQRGFIKNVLCQLSPASCFPSGYRSPRCQATCGPSHCRLSSLYMSEAASRRPPTPPRPATPLPLPVLRTKAARRQKALPPGARPWGAVAHYLHLTSCLSPDNRPTPCVSVRGEGPQTLT